MEERNDPVLIWLKVCAALHWGPRSSLLLVAWRGDCLKPPLYDPAADDNQRPTPMHAPCPISFPYLLLATGSSTELRCQCITHSHTSAGQTRSIMTTSLYHKVGPLGKDRGTTGRR